MQTFVYRASERGGFEPLLIFLAQRRPGSEDRSTRIDNSGRAERDSVRHAARNIRSNDHHFVVPGPRDIDSLSGLGFDRFAAKIVSANEAAIMVRRELMLFCFRVTK